MNEEDVALIAQVRRKLGDEAAAQIADRLADKYKAHADELRRYMVERAARRP